MTDVDGKAGSETGLREVTMYCDGACRGNPGLGAYGVVLLHDGRKKEISGVVEATTNNRMELTSAIVGLEALHERCRVRVFTDSRYVKNGITEWIHNWVRQGWKRRGKPVLNRELWERLLALSKQHEVHWEWVPGHDGVHYNEECDRLANEAMDAYLREKREAGR